MLSTGITPETKLTGQLAYADHADDAAGGFMSECWMEVCERGVTVSALPLVNQLTVRLHKQTQRLLQFHFTLSYLGAALCQICQYPLFPLLDLKIIERF